jgi:Tfp pilus assembly protein PilN
MAALGEVVNRTSDLFLATVTPEGERLSIKGQSTSVESMAVFIASLTRSRSFDDVQLRQYFEDDQDNRLAYRFSLDCIYRLPAGTLPVTAQPAAASVAPGRRAEK